MVSYEEDTLNNAFALCENYLIDKQISENIVKQQEDLKKLKILLKYLSAHTGIEHSSSSQSLSLYHNFVAQTNLGLETEPWVDSVFPYGQLWNMSVIEYKLQSYTNRMKRLTGGIWIRKFLDHVNNFVEKTDDYKAYFYINHEFHTAAILNTLGVYDPHIPNYLSTVIFELHEINNEIYVKVIHKKGHMLTKLVIPGCQKSLCSLQTFEKVLKNVTLDDFEEDCGKRTYFESLK
ncbi:venom acid phosphatase Acph-1-like [Cotesia glomerata]|uniref:acid phosphatase n=1 Tax=Cotesia glomerata TaxID=32391 RepID=A0AAV7J6W4_COTGL|nr:venom acid phosphatase Acph-1-like [Cotesia glomerata]KAH0568810.1 hypothetical protein KQX54_021504 [Cotesia glomerata]